MLRRHALAPTSDVLRRLANNPVEQAIDRMQDFMNAERDIQQYRVPSDITSFPWLAMLRQNHENQPPGVSLDNFLARPQEP